MWAKTKTGSQVTCPFCRSAWEGDPEMVLKVERSRGTMQEGYLNVAEQLGMSTERGMFFFLFFSLWLSCVSSGVPFFVVCFSRCLDTVKMVAYEVTLLLQIIVATLSGFPVEGAGEGSVWAGSAR